MSFTEADRNFMAMAIEEGKKGLGFVAPNPAVGCVIVSVDGEIIGKGYHRKFGGPHAEVEAVNSIADSAKLKQATVYVTLEPCSHHGKTPSCAHMLSQLPIRKVIFGCADINPMAARGREVLIQKGIECEHLQEMDLACFELAEVFFCNQSEKRAFIQLKVGASLDGQMGLSSGESQWITSEESRMKVQEIRGQMDAVLIGRQTLETDNPRLNSRHERFLSRTNKAIILDPLAKSLKTLSSASALTSVRESKDVFVVVDESNSPSISEDSEFSVVRCETINGAFDLNLLSAKLFKQGICSVLVEGGATTLSQFINQSLIDRLTVFIAPTIIGGKNGVTWTKDVEVSKLNDQIRLENVQVTQYGSDFCFSYGVAANKRSRPH